MMRKWNAAQYAKLILAALLLRSLGIHVLMTLHILSVVLIPVAMITFARNVFTA
jgi:hypothetical protein